MKLTKIGLLSLSLMTLTHAEIHLVLGEKTKKSNTEKPLFTPKVEIIGNLTTIIPKENSIVQESTNGNVDILNVSSYILPKIKNGKLKIGADINTPLCGEKTYLVAVGINQYKHTRLKLREAVNDAKKIVKKIESNCKNTQTYLLLNSKATQKNIKARVEEINKKATKKDTVIFFYSGNGFNYQNKNYIFSYDSKVKKDKPLINTFISVKDISSIFKSHKIKKGLMIFDACTSKIDNRVR